MKKKIEKLIQKKIDGALSPKGEDKFSRLIAKSEEAKILYERLLILDQLIKNDSKNIKNVDLSDSILDSLTTGGKKNIPIKTLQFKLNKQNLFKYAAILILGIFIGGTAGILFFGNNSEIDQQTIKGTIERKTTDFSIFSDENTSISIQDIYTENISIAIINIKTVNPVECEISGRLHKITQLEIEPLVNNLNIGLYKEEDNRLKYMINGPVVFQVKNQSGNSLELNFYRDNKTIAQKKLD